MVCDCIEWIVKKRKVWNKQTNKMEWIEFLRLSVNDDYNGNMNDCDVQDQLRTVYRFDYWLRQRKWWWAIFLFAFQLLLTDAYVSYCRA
jgi:hypothetical protein